MDNTIHVYKKDGLTLRFKEDTRRLYYFYLADRDEEETVLITP